MNKRFIQIYVTQDDSGHWYVIPYNLREKFEIDLYEDEEYFDDKYGKFRTNGDINNIKLFVEDNSIVTNNC